MFFDRTSRVIALCTVLLFVAPLTHAASENDAGSGGDAGNTRATATSVAYGSYSGYVNSKNDTDWYRARGATEPACIRGTLLAKENPQAAAFGLERNGQATLDLMKVPVGATQTFGMAGTAFTGAVLGVTALDDGAGTRSRPGAYDFSITRVGFSARSTQDALTGSDAGDSLVTATPASAGCIQGHLDPMAKLLGDNTDVYAISTKAGDVVTFSLAAATDAPIALTLYDAAGNALATVNPDGLATYTTTIDGTLYLSVTRTSSANVVSIAYIIGLLFGPDPPSCTPNCY